MGIAKKTMILKLYSWGSDRHGLIAEHGDSNTRVMSSNPSHFTIKTVVMKTVRSNLMEMHPSREKLRPLSLFR